MTTPITTPTEPRTPRFYHAPPAPTFTALGAIGTVAGATGTFILAAGFATALGASTTLALVLGQLAFVAVPIGIVVGTRGSATALGLARPHGRTALAAVLIGSSMWVLTATLAGLLPHRAEDTAALEALATQPSAVVVYLSIAVVPAVCEEIVFRGVLTRGLATFLRPGVAIVASAALFSAYHLNLAQLAPTFVLGLGLGALAVRSGSALPSMLAHLLNNTAGLLFSRDAVLARSLAEHPAMYVAGATVLTASGLALLVRSPS